MPILSLGEPDICKKGLRKYRQLQRGSTIGSILLLESNRDKCKNQRKIQYIKYETTKKVVFGSV